MNLTRISNNITAYNEHFRSIHPKTPNYERLLGCMVKLSEEVGELAEAILHSGGHQRNDKGEADIASEIADVIICALMIGDLEKIDVWATLENKLAKNNTRLHIDI
jgi:NTP pyrophosphatase (non-canonical NTP hydrolase)